MVPPNLNVKILLFAQARDHAGSGRLDLELPQGSRVADLVTAVARAHPALDPLWPHMAIAVDGQLAGRDAPLRDGSEVALLPPVSGG